MRPANLPSSPTAQDGNPVRREPGRRILSVGAALLFVAWNTVPRADAVILADNLDRPEDGVENVNRTRWLASKFRVGEGNFFLTDATLRLLQTAGGRAEVALYSDAGDKPGQMVGVLKLTGKLTGAPGDVKFLAPMSGEAFSASGAEFLSSMELPAGARVGDFDGEFVASGTRPSGLRLAPDSDYWLVVRSTGGEFAQVYTDSELGRGAGFSPAWAESANSGTTWTGHVTSPLIHQIGAEEGIPIVEFRIDNEAIASAIASALPMALIQRETVFAVADTASRDINARLFRLRSESGSGELDPVAGGKSKEDGKTADDSKGKPGSAWEIFVAGNYGSRDVEAMGLATGFNADIVTATAGVEYRPCRSFALGGALTAIESDNAVGRNVGDSDIEGLAMSVYASARYRNFYADLLYAYGEFEHELSRNTLFGHTARARPDSVAHTLQFNTGAAFDFRGFVTGPFLSLTYVTGDLDGYRETDGGTASVVVPDQNFDSLVSQLGWQVSREFQCARGLRVTPQLRASWSHEYRNRVESVDVRLADSPFAIGDGRTFTPFGSFQVAGKTAKPGEDSLDLAAAIRVDCGDRCSIFLDYATRLARTHDLAQFVSLTASVRF